MPWIDWRTAATWFVTARSFSSCPACRTRDLIKQAHVRCGHARVQRTAISKKLRPPEKVEEGMNHVFMCAAEDGAHPPRDEPIHSDHERQPCDATHPRLRSAHATRQEPHSDGSGSFFRNFLTRRWIPTASHPSFSVYRRGHARPDSERFGVRAVHD